MGKRVVAIGLLTSFSGDIVVYSCECCGQPYDTLDTRKWVNLGQSMCPVCCTVRCDAYPGECPNKDSMIKPWGGSEEDRIYGSLYSKVM